MCTHAGEQRSESADMSKFAVNFPFLLSGTQTLKLAILRLSDKEGKFKSLSVLMSLSNGGNACLKSAFTTRKHLSQINCLGVSITNRQM